MCSFAGCFWLKKAATLGAALIAAPSTGLPEYLRTVSAREISSLHGNKAQLPVKPLYAQKKERFKRRGGSAGRKCGDTHCIQERLWCYHAGSIPYVNARCCRRCQTLRGAVLGNGPPCLGLQQFSLYCACARLHAVEGSL